MEQLLGDVLGEIFGHIDDLADMIHLAQTCRVFWAKYVKIRARLPQLYIKTKQFNYARKMNIIKVKNYSLIIVYSHPYIHDYGSIHKVDYIPCDPGMWECISSAFTADFCFERNGKLLFVIEDVLDKIKECKFGFIGANNRKKYLELPKICISKYLHIYDTFLHHANIDDKFKEFFRSIPDNAKQL